MNQLLMRCVQDPVARTVSSHNMEIEAQKSSKKCWGRGTNRVCRREMLPLLQEFRSQRDLDFDWPEDLSGCNFNETVRVARKRHSIFWQHP